MGRLFPVLTLLATLHAQQVPDTAFRPLIAKPAFPPGQGPVVLVDEAHFNFHTAAGRYRPFADLLARDGYVVKASASKFTAEALRAAKILVVCNALHERNRQDWSPPHLPAFEDGEVAAVREWVEAGGSLLLIADHAPFAAAAAKLGAAFGIRFLSGYATIPNRPGPLVFSKSDGTLKEHAVTRGIDEVATFTGSSFETGELAQPLLVFGPGVVSIMGRNDAHPAPVTGHIQGAVLDSGKGRAAIFGEAAMFSGQLAGRDKRPMGMNAPAARQNAQFLLNVMRWLAGATPPSSP